MINKNVYWFLIDGLSPKFLNVCGNKQYGKTFIDKCLEKGTVLSQMYCGNGGTHTSMHVFFSGFRSSVNGAKGWIIEALRSFNPEIFTLTDFFKLNGYNTYRYCDAKGERTVPKSGFDVWMHSGYRIGRFLGNTDYSDCEKRSEFINMVNSDNGRKFVYHHLELLHDLNTSLGTCWSSDDYRKNIEITAKHFEKLYKSYNISDDDIVIISSDHGVLLDVDYTKYESVYGPRQHEQSNICLFSISGNGIKSQLLDGLSTAVDVAPTLVEMFFNQKLPAQGTSIQDYIKNGVYEPKLCFREKGTYFTEPQSPDKSDIYSVRDNNWKYTFSLTFANSEWLVNLDENEDYVDNLKDKYPELVKKYKKLIYDEIINKKIDIKKFYSEHGFNLSKKDIKPEILITIKGSVLSDEFMESVLDFAGPYYNVVLSQGQAVTVNKKYLEHPKVKIADNVLDLDGNYIASIKTKYNYDDEDFLVSFYQNAKKYGCKVAWKSDRSIYIVPKKTFKTKKTVLLKNKDLISNPNALKWFYKERIGNKRVIHIGPIKIRYNKHFVKMLRLKQDKNSEVEFYLVDAFEIYHYLPIYNELKRRGIKTRIVAEPCFLNTGGSWFDYNTAIKILKHLHIDYCNKCNPQAKIAVTTQRANILSKYKNKKINFSYGFGFTKNYFINSKESVEGFDVKFVHGDYQKKLVDSYRLPVKVIKFGYPKYQDFFGKTNDRNALLKKLNVTTDKKIITYFPTWDEDSSIQCFADAIKILKNKYFIITKPHHCTFRLPDKKDDLEMLYKISDVVLDGNYDFTEATLLGDIALCDAKSGASCEVPYLNKDINVLLLNPHKNTDKYISEIDEYFTVISNPLDLEAYIKKVYNSKENRGKIDEFISKIYDNITVQQATDFITSELN